MSDHQDMPEPAGADADTPLEPWLQALASSYHRPPPAPREAMWARIQAARAGDQGDAGDAGADGGADGAAVVVMAAGSVRAAELATGDDLARRRASGGGSAGGAAAGNGRAPNAWAGPSLGIAAALLLAAGLGWWTRTPAVPSPAPSSAPAAVATVPADGAPSVVEPSGAEPSGAGPTTVAAGRVAAPRAATTGRRLPAAGDARATARLAAARDGDLDVGAAAAGTDAADSPYRLAAVQHLGQAEALLTVFRAGNARDAADPSLQPWARELLTTTRLLLDSPAGRDPRLGALLGELEPVLVQIVQLPAARAAEERLLIARSIERSDLMTQLRSAVPAGPAVPQRAGE